MPFPLRMPATASWREEALTRIAEFRYLAAWLQLEPEVPRGHPLNQGLEEHLTEAQDEALQRGSVRHSVTGVSVERTFSRLDAAEVLLLQIAPLPYVTGQLPSLVTHVNRHLESADLRRTAVAAIYARLRPDVRRHGGSGNATEPTLTEVDRRTVVAAVRAASSAARREEMRLRSFRNVLLFTGAFLTVVAVAMLGIGIWRPELLPLCFTPDNPLRVVCPIQDNVLDATEVAGNAGEGGSEEGQEELRLVSSTEIADTASRWDVPVIMLLGSVAAGIAAATALRRIKGTSTPYALPVALAVLKLPTGAITAVLGLILMRGGFVPGLSNLDTSAQVLAWGVIFGYAQQLFTGLVDTQAQQVLESVKRSPAASRDDQVADPT